MTRVAGLLALLAAACGDGGTPPPDVPADAPPRLVEVAAGLGQLTDLAAPPGDRTRLFVAEQAGRVRVIRGGALLPAPFLDLTGRLSTGGERGLLGIAFHPQYATNGLLVVHYTDPRGDTRVVTVRASAANPDLADPASERVIFTTAQPFANHNGGQVAFGPDGLLYLGLGDGGSGGDPQGNAQNPATPLGKLLRLRVAADGQVSVPADNPFAGQAGARPEIWSLGLRNPWRFSFDRQTGDLYVADVGQSDREEVNVAGGPAAGRGANFGWNVMEGTRCFRPASGCSQAGLTLPVVEYDHGQGCSITGGYVYRGNAVPALQGQYLFADFCQGWVRSVRVSGGTASAVTDWPSLRPGGSITSFGEDADGELYLLTSAGRVYRIAP